MPHPPRRERESKPVVRLVAGAVLSAAVRSLIDWLTGR